MSGVWLAVLLFGEASAASRVAVVVSDDLAPYTDPVPAFLEALGEPAQVFNLHGRRSEADALVDRLRENRPEVAFCLGAKAAWTVHRSLPGLPVVYASVIEPERYGLDGPAVTGIAMTPDPVATISNFTTFFGDVKRIGVLRGPAIDDDRWREMERAAGDVGVELVFARVEQPRGLRAAYAELAPRVDGLWLVPDRAVLTPESFRLLTEETRRRRQPLLVETENMVEAGGLFAVVPDPGGIGRQAAALARAILDGRPPGSLPPAYPEDVRVAMNLRTLELAQVPFDRLLLDFVDRRIE